MAKRRNEQTERDQALAQEPQSIAIAAKGVTTGQDFALLMSALMGDILAGRVDANTGNAVCRAGDKLLKVVEMQYRYGAKAHEPRPAFQLVG